MHFVGLDIHRKFIYGTVLDSKGKIVNQGQFPTTEDEINVVVHWLVTAGKLTVEEQEKDDSDSKT